MVADIAAQVTNRTGIKVFPRDVLRVVGALGTTDNFWRVASLVRLPFNAVAEILNSLTEAGVVVVEDGSLRVSPAGHAWVEAARTEAPFVARCRTCGGRGLDLGLFQELLAWLREIGRSRPAPIKEFDQGYVTPESTVARVALLAARGDLADKELLVLGDDDLVSLAAAFTRRPKRVVVLEVDPRLTRFIEEAARAYDLVVEVLEQDIRARWPEHLLHRFDTFLTDPPETLEGLDLFLGRGLASLKGPRCAGYFGLTFTECSLEKWQLLQRRLTGRFGVVITDIIANFNEYVNWDYLLDSVRKDLGFVQVPPAGNWYRSAMYRVEVVESVAGHTDSASNAELYVDREALAYTGRT